VTILVSLLASHHHTIKPHKKNKNLTEFYVHVDF